MSVPCIILRPCSDLLNGLVRSSYRQLTNFRLMRLLNTIAIHVVNCMGAYIHTANGVSQCARSQLRPPRAPRLWCTVKRQKEARFNDLTLSE